MGTRHAGPPGNNEDRVFLELRIARLAASLSRQRTPGKRPDSSVIRSPAEAVCATGRADRAHSIQLQLNMREISSRKSNTR
jgi:hypothetical protein